MMRGHRRRARATGARDLAAPAPSQGTVKDPTGRRWWPSSVDISNPVTGFKRSTTTDAAGKFVVPEPAAESAITWRSPRRASRTLERDVDVRSARADRRSTVALDVAGTTESVRSSGTRGSARARSDGAHRHRPEPDRASCRSSPRSGLNQVITLASPGVVADSNGFFHPVGDHAQTQFSIDNQPVTDQQSRVYSNQISPDAVQSMEVITGRRARRVRRQEQPRRPHRHEVRPRPAEADRRASRSATDRSRVRRSMRTSAAARTPSATFCRSAGLRTDRFLDPPEFAGAPRHGTAAVAVRSPRRAHRRRPTRSISTCRWPGRRSTCRTRSIRTPRGRISTRRSTPSTSRRATHG